MIQEVLFSKRQREIEENKNTIKCKARSNAGQHFKVKCAIYQCCAVY